LYGPATLKPRAFAGTNQIELSPSAAVGRLDHTYALALAAEVIQLFCAFITTDPFFLVAELTGAQKWLREPPSENASVLR
jgi:hypothetical protein